MAYSLNVWDIFDKFKMICRLRGWENFEHEDLVKADGKYHYLILTHEIHPETFKKVVLNPHQGIREKDSYKIVNVSYIAWISERGIPEEVLSFLTENPSLLNRVALYDVSPLHEGRKECLRINETDSSVFLEFENFLSSRGIGIKPLKRRVSING